MAERKSFQKEKFLRHNQHRSKSGGRTRAGEGEEPSRGLIINEDELWHLLPEYDWEIIKLYAKKNPNIEFNKVKFLVSQMFKKLEKAGRASPTRIEEFPEQRATAFHYLRKDELGRSNVSEMHIYMQKSAKNAISQLYRIEHDSGSGELSNLDLITATLDVEIETGYKLSKCPRRSGNIIWPKGNLY